MHAGDIRGMHILGENPAMSDPDLDMRAALVKLDHLVVQDILLTETANFADVVSPASDFVEKPKPSPTPTARSRWAVLPSRLRARSGRTGPYLQTWSCSIRLCRSCDQCPDQPCARSVRHDSGIRVSCGQGGAGKDFRHVRKRQCRMTEKDPTWNTFDVWSRATPSKLFEYRRGAGPRPKHWHGRCGWLNC